MVCETLKTKDAGLYNITGQVTAVIEKSGINEGLCVVFAPDAESGILVISKGDSLICEDIMEDFSRVFPARNNYEYKGSLECAAAHSKSAVAGVSLDVIIHDGKAVLGNYQEIVLADYVGDKECTFMVQCIGKK